jgi:hypothetical protein
VELIHKIKVFVLRKVTHPFGFLRARGEMRDPGAGQFGPKGRLLYPTQINNHAARASRARQNFAVSCKPPGERCKCRMSEVYLRRFVGNRSTHLLGTTPVGASVTSSERLGPVERSNGRIAVLARRPAKNYQVFCDFVASRGREGPPSILATS